MSQLVILSGPAPCPALPNGKLVTSGVAPQTIFNTVYDEVSAALMKGNNGEFLRRSLLQKADKLQKADPLGAMEIKAYVAALVGDFDSADELYSRVFIASGHDWQRVLHYLLLLSATGQSIKMYRAFEDHITINELPPSARAYVAQLLGFTGWIVEAASLRDELVKQGHHVRTSSFNELDYLANAENSDDEKGSKVSVFPTLNHTSVLAENGINEENIALVVGDALTYLRGSGLPALGVRTTVVPEERGGGGILINLLIDAESEAASDAEWNLYEHLGERDSIALSSGAVSLAIIPKAGLTINAN